MVFLRTAQALWPYPADLADQKLGLWMKIECFFRCDANFFACSPESRCHQQRMVETSEGREAEGR